METRKPGIATDITRLKAASAGSAAEMRDFVHSLKGRSPQEVLGLVAQSSLLNGVIQATLGCIVLTAIFTVVPYAMGKMAPAKSKKGEEKPAAASKASEPAPAASTSANTSSGTDAATPVAAPKGKSGDDLLDKLGVGESVESDPGKNPLENDKDDLLKELK